MSFMLQIDNARPCELDTLATDYFAIRSGRPSLEFCHRTAGVPASDEVIARRLGVAISTVRGWREVGVLAALAGGSPAAFGEIADVAGVTGMKELVGGNLV